MTVRVIHADCRDALCEIADASIDACVTDPPYALVSIGKRFGSDTAAPCKEGKTGAYARASRGFMGKKWDTGEVAFDPETWREVWRVLKPGGHLIAFGGTRTFHRLACAIEDAGFEIRDMIMWLYGCLDDQTQAVTPNGIMPYHKINQGDLVLAYDPTHMSYQWEQVQEVCVYDVDDTVYRIATDFGDQVVSRNHRCIVERDGAETFEFAENAARQREIRVPVLEDLRALLDAVPDAHAGASVSQSDVFAGLHEGGFGSEAVGDGYNSRPTRGEDASDLCSLRNDVLAEREACRASDDADLQLRVQRGATWSGLEDIRTYGPGELDAGIRGSLGGAHDGRDESGLEGRGYIPQSQGELRLGSVCEVPTGVPADVAQGRLHHGASPERGDGNGPTVKTGGMCASHRPQPAEQRTDESDAVRDEQGPQAVRAWGGHKAVVGRITPEHYRGVIWCVRVKSGAFVAVRNGFAFPTGNSGFPKSHDVSKGIDRAGGTPWAGFAGLLDDLIKSSGHTYASLDRALGIKSSSCYWVRTDSRGGLPPRHHYERIKSLINPPKEFTDLYDKAEREVIAIDRRKNSPSGIVSAGRESVDVERKITAPATDAARQWQGWGTALKPAHEPIVMARKPLIGTVAANVLAHGTGALNIDASRVHCGDVEGPRHRHGGGIKGAGTSYELPDSKNEQPPGRWPANVIHDGSDEVVTAFPESDGAVSNGKKAGTGYEGGWKGMPQVDSYADSGTAARFFYSAKADAEDRLESKHPTVKPVDLIAYLVRLVTPPGGTVIDPFAGSGTLGMACMREGFDAILIEREAEYIADIRRRINHVQGNDTPLFGGSTVSPPPARVVPSTDGSRTKDRPDGIAVMIEKEEAA